ncbi:diflavin flavoprotein [[Limnothrix rosea] IAM M-220]|uniref:diflavin flavoprotein n=1 Tax=[Limnothrix rosea] IAM M-220 TaxID=454133 RepID=UPI0009626DF8|nr:diflavin flavoprotein [[Limnothrix rosea] IAM M-220]OKH19332.1 flavin oxidoreductase [[Limnothrix rosea] IAM M-220]
MSVTTTLNPTRPKDVQVVEIAPNTLMLRSRTWDRLKFEIEYARQQGTTANSFLIRGDRPTLIDPPGESFTDIYLSALAEHFDLTTLEYVILSHINANRMVTLEALLQKAPQATVVCSHLGANIFRMAFPQWTDRVQVVRGESTLEIHHGHPLVLTTVPTPRWIDGLCTFDPTTQILYTDKLFGVHVCSDAVFDEAWKELDGDRRYYFDCLHAPQSKSVEKALEKLEKFPAQIYAPGHGPLVRYSLSRFVYDYHQWCQRQKSKELTVALLYASAYGNTAVLARAIAQGLIDEGLQVNTINCETAEPAEITEAIEACDGFLIGSPTLAGHAPTQIQTALGIILSTATPTKLAGVFGSYGWSGEAIGFLENKLRDANYRFGFDAIRVKFTPDAAVLESCQESASKFAKTLKANKKLRSPGLNRTKTKGDRTTQAVDRIVGSLCVVTTRDGDTHKGVLSSSVTQASFNPPGLVIAVSAGQNADLMMHQGDQFTLNILKEGRNVRRYFFHHSIIGENPFEELSTTVGNNGCLILQEALSYLECTVQQQMQCGDRHLIYATVAHGQVLENSGITAIEHHR